MDTFIAQFTISGVKIDVKAFSSMCGALVS